jgi:hypothetical protein
MTTAAKQLFSIEGNVSSTELKKNIQRQINLPMSTDRFTDYK